MFHITLDDENALQHVTSVLVMVLGNQPEASASDISDNQSPLLVYKWKLVIVKFYTQKLCHKRQLLNLDYFQGQSVHGRVSAKYEGRSINKFQNGAIPIILNVGKI